MAITPGTPFAPKYGGLYDDGRLLEPGAKAEREAALLTDEWNDPRLLSAAATLYTRVAPVVQRWQTARKSLRKLLRKTTYRPARRDRIRCDELDDERVKTGKWLAAIDQRAYVVHVHMASRLPDLQLHEEILARYRSVLRFQVFVADAREFRDRTAAFSERLTSTFTPPFALRRDAAHEFNNSRDDFAGLLADAAEHNDPLLLAFTDGIPLDRFLYAHDGKSTFKSDRNGRRLTHAWDEVVQKADWLHYRNVAALIALHESIQQAFTAIATQPILSDSEPQIELLDEPTLADDAPGAAI
jgi:hypothetical protein